jgi:hypothetical protein
MTLLIFSNNSNSIGNNTKIDFGTFWRTIFSNGSRMAIPIVTNTVTSDDTRIVNISLMEIVLNSSVNFDMIFLT